MKKYLLSALVIFALGSVSQAASSDVRLQFNDTSLLAGGTSKTFKVLGDGSVVASACHAVAVKPCRFAALTSLTADQMDVIENNIRDAQNGPVVHMKNLAECFVAPHNTRKYMADNGKEFLFAGNPPCAPYAYNNTPAAKALVRQMDEMRVELYKVFP